MPNPTQSDVHVDRPLTNISVAFMQDASDFIADRVFLTLPVAKQSDQYFLYNRGDFNRDEMQLRAPGTQSAGGGYRISTATYFCPVNAFHKDIDDQVRANADTPLQLNREATEYVTQKFLIKREKDFVAAAFAASIWDTDVIGTAAAPGAGEVLNWSDAASTPVEDIRGYRTTMKQLSGFRPNVLTLSTDVWDTLLDHPDVLDRIKYGQTAPGPAIANRVTLAALFELDEILVLDSIENTDPESAPAGETSAFISGAESALLSYRPARPGIMTPASGYTFGWTGYLGASAAGSRIKSFRFEAIASDRIEIEAAYSHEVVATELGVMFTTLLTGA